MKFLSRILTVACVTILLLSTVQCEVIDSSLLDDPNNVSSENVDPDFLLNNIQIAARDAYEEAAETGAEMTRIRYMFGDTYGNAYNSQSFDNLYVTTYASLLIDVKNLLPITEERQLFVHSGIAKTLQAYAMITLADTFGDVPFSEALDPGNFNPGLEDDEQIYNKALEMLDSAISDLRNTDRRAFPQNDLYYGDISDDSTRAEAWVKAANTIKLKAYLNMGDAGAFNSLVSGGNLILAPEDNFTYEFSTNTTNPDARHPLFSNNYVDQANDYMAVNYLNMMLNDKPTADPRIRYYFYRQTTSDPSDVNLNTCIAANKPSHFTSEDPFCLLGNGWWGRDHLIDDGIPPDGDLRTTVGVYPAGGRFDAGQGEPTEEEMGYQGAGFQPILMASYTQFMIAEAELMLNSNPGGARTALEDGIRQSMETVRDFGAAQADTLFDISDNGIDSYVDIVNDRWNNNTGTQDRLRIISKEYYLALWPNGLEAYNMMRRTGYPDRQDNMQPARSPNPGNWYRSFSYPSDLVERNSNVSPKASNLARVFWDTRGSDTEFNY